MCMTKSAGNKRIALNIDAHPTLTDFQRRVYHALLQVPPGRVISYGALARRIGCGSARAIGQALRSNPLAPSVPCHRVINAKGLLGGFQGSREPAPVARKRLLLLHEGVAFDAEGRLRDPSRLIPQTTSG